MSEVKFPTEVVTFHLRDYCIQRKCTIISKIEIKYMTAKEEDILTSVNLIKKGIVIETLLKALIVDKSIKVDDMLLGDKNAVLVALVFSLMVKSIKFK